MNTLPGSVRGLIPKCKLGILTMAYGDETFCRLAENLSLSARHFAPEVPLAIVTEPAYQKRFATYFDHVILLDPTRGGGMRQKLFLYEYSPFEETLVLDADTLILRPIESLVEEMRGHDVFTVLGRAHETEDWRYSFRRAQDEFGIPWVAQFNGGCYYFRRSVRAESVVRLAQSLLSDWASVCQRLQLKASKKSSDLPPVSEELLLSLSLAQHRIPPLDDYEVRRMIGPLQMRSGHLTWDLLRGQCVARSGKSEWSPYIGHFFWGAYEGFHYIREVSKLRDLMQQGDLSLVLRLRLWCGSILYWIVTFIYSQRDRLLNRSPHARILQAGVPMKRFMGKTGLGIGSLLKAILRVDERA